MRYKDYLYRASKFAFVCFRTFLRSNLQTLRASCGSDTKGSGLRFSECSRHTADRLIFSKRLCKKTLEETHTVTLEEPGLLCHFIVQQI